MSEPTIDKSNFDSTGKVVVVIGLTGAGKSSFCNTLIDATWEQESANLAFKPYTGQAAGTNDCVLRTGTWLKDPTEAIEGKVTIVDTPGLADGQCRDGQFMTKI